MSRIAILIIELLMVLLSLSSCASSVSTFRTREMNPNDIEGIKSKISKHFFGLYSGLGYKFGGKK